MSHESTQDDSEDSYGIFEARTVIYRLGMVVNGG